MPVGFEVVPDFDASTVDMANVACPNKWDAWRVCTVGKCYTGAHYADYSPPADCEVKDTSKMWEKSGNQYRILPGTYYLLLTTHYSLLTTDY